MWTATLETGETYYLRGPLITLGRSAENNLSFPADKSISRAHAEIAIDDANPTVLTLTDKGSRFGSKLLHTPQVPRESSLNPQPAYIPEPLTPNVAVVVSSGQVIQLGSFNTLVRFTYEVMRVCITRLERHEKESLKELLLSARARLVSRVQDATHLVSPKLAATLKAITAIALQIPIIRPPWLYFLRSPLPASLIPDTAQYSSLLTAPATQSVGMMNCVDLSTQMPTQFVNSGHQLDIQSQQVIMAGGSSQNVTSQFPAAAPMTVSRRSLLGGLAVVLPIGAVDYEAAITACGAVVVPAQQAHLFIQEVHQVNQQQQLRICIFYEDGRKDVLQTGLVGDLLLSLQSMSAQLPSPPVLLSSSNLAIAVMNATPPVLMSIDIVIPRSSANSGHLIDRPVSTAPLEVQLGVPTSKVQSSNIAYLEEPTSKNAGDEDLDTSAEVIVSRVTGDSIQTEVTTTFQRKRSREISVRSEPAESNLTHKSIPPQANPVVTAGPDPGDLLATADSKTDNRCTSADPPDDPRATADPDTDGWLTPRSPSAARSYGDLNPRLQSHAHLSVSPVGYDSDNGGGDLNRQGDIGVASLPRPAITVERLLVVRVTSVRMTRNRPDSTIPVSGRDVRRFVKNRVPAPTSDSDRMRVANMVRVLPRESERQVQLKMETEIEVRKKRAAEKLWREGLNCGGGK